MKLKNKKTGEIVDLSEGVITDTYGGEKIQIKPVAISNNEGYVYSSLAELNEEWEDAPEEPKGYYYVTTTGLIKYDDTPFCAIHKDRKEIGNYFETKEEAEQAVRKLKAWKRLKDNSLRFADLRFDYDELGGTIKFKTNLYGGITYDLDLLFGGEE